MAKRNARGQFVKGSSTGGGKRRKRSSSKSIVRRSGGAVVVVGNRSPAVRRRPSGGGSLLSARGVSSYLGNVRGDDLLASGGLGLVVNKQRATVETIVNYAPDFMAPLGAYGIIAVMSGVASHYGIGRRVLGPVARVAAIIAANKIGTKGGLFAAKTDSLSGDDGDEAAGDDYIDVGTLEDLGEDDAESAGEDGDDDGGMAGDDEPEAAARQVGRHEG